MSSEAAIEKFVERHFEDLGFVTKRQHTIQIGSNTGRADVVIYNKHFALLSDPLDHIAAIVECKAEGKMNDGIGQLKSYLCATDTRLGVFANSLFPEKWKYYENYGRNDIPEISRMKFTSILRNEKEKQEDFQRRIQKRTEQRIEQAATKLATSERIAERRELIINQEANKRIKENDFRSATEWNLKRALNIEKEIAKNGIASLKAEVRATEQHLKTALDNTKKEITSLKAEVSEKKGCLWTSILVLGGLLVIFLIAVNS